MTLTMDQWLYIVAAIIVPIISIIIIKKRPRKNIMNIENSEIITIKQILKKLENQVEKNHIEIDNLRGKVAFIEGRLSK